jgi:AraC-like DNA-binding protein
MGSNQEITGNDVSSVPTFYIMQLEKVLAREGVALASCLDEQGLCYEQFKQAGAKMAAEHFIILVNTLVEGHGIKRPGVLLGEALQLIHHGPFGLAIMNSPTVIDIISLFERFIAMRVPGLELHIIEKHNDIVVTVHDLYWREHLHQFFIDALTSALLNLHSSLVSEGNSPVISRVVFDYSMDKHGCKSHRQHLHSECSAPDIERLYDQPYCAIVLDKSKAHQPLVNSDKVSFDYAVKLCEMEYEALVVNNATEKLRHFLRQHNATIPSLENAADALCISKRTLHRQLEKENTSFRKEREKTLMRKALDLLFVKRLSVKQTAYQLGYTEPTNFRRAFVNYYGRPPSAF